MERTGNVFRDAHAPRVHNQRVCIRALSAARSDHKAGHSFDIGPIPAAR